MTRLPIGRDDHPLARHPHFTPSTDPHSGVASFVLSEAAAPVQRSLYFVRPCIGRGSRWLWFYAFHPPSKQPHVAVVSLDPDRPLIREFPHLEASGNPMLDEGDEEGGTILCPVGDGIYRQRVEGPCEEVWRLPKDFLQGRKLYRLVTDLTASCDSRKFLLDLWVGNQWCLALVDRATGDLEVLRWFGREHHHAIFSPHDPELFLVSHGHWVDPCTGRKSEMDVRMWFMDTRLTRYEPVDPGRWFGRNSRSCHEWWSPSGKVQFCDYEEGMTEIDLQTRKQEVFWPRPCAHGQVSPDGRLNCSDVNPYNWNDDKPCSVWLYDRNRSLEIPIVSAMPPQPLDWRDFRAYHIDPHPQFSVDGDLISYTTTGLGPVGVALTPVAPALERLREAGQPYPWMPGAPA